MNIYRSLNFSLDRPKTLTEEAAALPVPVVDGLGQALQPSLQLNVFIEMPARQPVITRSPFRGSTAV